MLNFVNAPAAPAPRAVHSTSLLSAAVPGWQPARWPRARGRRNPATRRAPQSGKGSQDLLYLAWPMMLFMLGRSRHSVMNLHVALILRSPLGHRPNSAPPLAVGVASCCSVLWFARCSSRSVGSSPDRVGSRVAPSRFRSSPPVWRASPSADRQSSGAIALFPRASPSLVFGASVVRAPVAWGGVGRCCCSRRWRAH